MGSQVCGGEGSSPTENTIGLTGGFKGRADESDLELSSLESSILRPSLHRKPSALVGDNVVAHVVQDRFMFSFRYQFGQRSKDGQDELIDQGTFTRELASKLDKLGVTGWRPMLRIHSVQKLDFTTSQYTNPVSFCSGMPIRKWTGLMVAEIAGTRAKVSEIKSVVAKAIESEEKLKILGAEAWMVQEQRFQPLQDAARNMHQAGRAAYDRIEINETTDKLSKLLNDVQTYTAKVDEQKQKAISNITAKFLKSFELQEGDFGWRKVEEQQRLSDLTMKVLVEEMKEFKKNEEKQRTTIRLALEDRKEWAERVNELKGEIELWSKENKELTEELRKTQAMQADRDVQQPPPEQHQGALEDLKPLLNAVQMEKAKLEAELSVAKKDVLEQYALPEPTALQNCLMRICCFPLAHMAILSHHEPLGRMGCWENFILKSCCCCVFGTDYIDGYTNCLEKYNGERFVCTVKTSSS